MTICDRHGTFTTGECPKCVAEAEQIKAMKPEKPGGMSDGKQKIAERWESTLQGILDGVRKRARIFLIVGFLVYGGGTGVILVLIPDKAFALVLQMFLFQLCVMYFGVDQVFQCIRGSFETMIENSRETMPVFDRMSNAAEGLMKATDEAKTGEADWVKRLERLFREEMRKLRQEIKGKRESTEDDLEKALEEGEAEAAKIREDGTTPAK